MLLLNRIFVISERALFTQKVLTRSRIVLAMATTPQTRMRCCLFCCLFVCLLLDHSSCLSTIMQHNAGTTCQQENDREKWFWKKIKKQECRSTQDWMSPSLRWHCLLGAIKSLQFFGRLTTCTHSTALAGQSKDYYRNEGQAQLPSLRDIVVRTEYFSIPSTMYSTSSMTYNTTKRYSLSHYYSTRQSTVD